MLAVLVLMAAIGCGGTPASSSYEDVIQGTWVAPCEHGTGYSMQSVQSISGTAYETKRMSFETENCTGTAVVARTYRGTFLIGPEVRAQFNDGYVTARHFDYTPEGRHTSYTLVYLDTSSTPNRMYLAADNDAPEHRPTRIETYVYIVKQ